MNKPVILLILISLSNSGYAQNIYVGLHINQDREYKTVKPKIIYETNKYDFDGKWFINNNIKILDGSGFLLTEERFAENGDKIIRLQYSYDTVKILITSMIFERWTRGYEKMIFIYTYDINQCLTSITQKDSLGNVFDQYEYVCNDKGYPSELFLIGKNGNRILKESATYFYDKNFASISLFTANKISFAMDTIKINDRLACKFALAKEKYNSNCDIVSYVRFDHDGHEMLFEKEYEYDTYGNRTEERSYSTIRDSTGNQIKKVHEVLKKNYVY